MTWDVTTARDLLVGEWMKLAEEKEPPGIMSAQHPSHFTASLGALGPIAGAIGGAMSTGGQLLEKKMVGKGLIDPKLHSLDFPHKGLKTPGKLLRQRMRSGAAGGVISGLISGLLLDAYINRTLRKND